MNSQLQRTPEWHAQRLGKLTASRFGDAVAKTRNGWGASRDRYIAELISERLTGVPYPSYVSREMMDGIDREPAALASYAFLRDIDPQPAGFVEHPRIPMSGASPDGYVGADGLIEVKCPAVHTHLAWLMGRASIPDDYVLQAMWQMACLPHIAWVDWMSYCPHLPARHQNYVHRMMRDEAMIERMEKQAVDFLAEVDRLLEQLK